MPLTNVIEIHLVLLFTLHNTKNIAYHITEVLIFYADKLLVMGNSKNSRNIHVLPCHGCCTAYNTCGSVTNRDPAPFNNNAVFTKKYCNEIPRCYKVAFKSISFTSLIRH